MKNAILEREVIRRSAHVYAEKVSWLDESAFALLRNRHLYIAQSAATVGRLPAHPPVPREKSLVVASCGMAWGDDDSPDVTSEHEPELPTEE